MPKSISTSYQIESRNVDELVEVVKQAYTGKNNMTQIENSLNEFSINFINIIKEQLKTEKDLHSVAVQLISAAQFPIGILDNQAKTAQNIYKLDALSQKNKEPEKIESPEKSDGAKKPKKTEPTLFRSELKEMRVLLKRTTLVTKLYPIYHRSLFLSESEKMLAKLKERSEKEQGLETEIATIEQTIKKEKEAQSKAWKDLATSILLEGPGMLEILGISLENLNVFSHIITITPTALIFIGGAFKVSMQAYASKKAYKDLKDFEQIEKSLLNSLYEEKEKALALLAEQMNPIHELCNTNKPVLEALLEENAGKPQAEQINNFAKEGIDIVQILKRRGLDSLSDLKDQDEGVKSDMLIQLTRHLNPKEYAVIEKQNALAMTTKKGLLALEQKKLSLEKIFVKRGFSTIVATLSAHLIELISLMTLIAVLGVTSPFTAIPVLAVSVVSSALLVIGLYTLKKYRPHLYKGLTFNAGLHVSLRWSQWKLLRKESAIHSKMHQLQTLSYRYLEEIALCKEMEELRASLSEGTVPDYLSRSLHQFILMPKEKALKELNIRIEKKRLLLDKFMEEKDRAGKTKMEKAADEIKALIQERTPLVANNQRLKKRIEHAKWKDFTSHAIIANDSTTYLANAFKEILADHPNRKAIDKILHRMGVGDESEESLKKFFTMNEKELLRLISEEGA